MTKASATGNSRLRVILLSLLTLAGFFGLLSTVASLASPAAAMQAGTAPAKSRPKATKQQAAGFQLREIRPNVFESPAGLLYLPGSEEGHRIDHVLQHLQDDPQKKLHGVFEGDRNRWLATIDEAWTKSAAGGPLVKRQQQNGRTVATVDLQRRLGYVGGSEGARRRKPECRLLRIVTENRREVITAYPVQAF